MSGRQRVDTVMVDSLQVDSPLALLATDGTDTALQRASRIFCPCKSTLYLPDATTCDLISQAIPSTFAYCEQSKTGGGNGLGLRVLNHTTNNTL